MNRILILGTLFALAACDGGTPENSRVDDVLALTGDTTAGETSYTSLCASCHEADGMGGDAYPDLTAFVAAESEGELVEAMLEGPGSMPVFDNQDDQVLADITAYVFATF